MKKVLFMTINMNVGGTEKALLNMITEMSNDKYDITILMLEEYGGFINNIPNHVHVMYLENYNDIKNILNNPPQQIVKELVSNGNIIKGSNILVLHIISKLTKDRSLFFKYVLKKHSSLEEEYDLAVAYAGPMDFISYFVANKIRSKKKAQWIHFDITKIGFSKYFADKIYSKFDKIFVVSEEGKKKLINLVPTLKSKCDVFFNVVSSELVCEQAKQGQGFTDNYKGTRILTVGRLSQEKGQDMCIEAMAKLKKYGYDIRWYCVGDGPYRKACEEMIKKEHLENDFILLGSSTNPYSYMKQCDIYVQPSRHEGYCITLAEARCFDNPIVTTNFVGASEQISSEETGLIVEGNSHDIYIAIKKILDNKQLAEKFKENLSKEKVDSSSEINKLDELMI